MKRLTCLSKTGLREWNGATRSKLHASFVFLFCLFFAVAAYADEITAYKQAWSDAYRKGYRDAYTDFTNNSSDYKALIDTIFDYKKILFSTDSAPMKITTEFEKKKTSAGVEYKKKVTVVPFTEESQILPLEILKNQFRESYKRTTVFTGWWSFISTNNLAKEDIGLLEFIAEQNGMSPKRFRDLLVFSIDERQAESAKVAQILKTYGIIVEVSYVEIK